MKEGGVGCRGGLGELQRPRRHCMGGGRLQIDEEDFRGKPGGRMVNARSLLRVGLGRQVVHLLCLVPVVEEKTEL
jgi:hypothetical protein